MRAAFFVFSIVAAFAPLFAEEPMVYPGDSWELVAPRDAGLSEPQLKAAAEMAGGRGCVVRGGRMAFAWGDISKPTDVASACKPVFTHLLILALQSGKVASLDENVAGRWEPRLTGDDRAITWRHFANQISCYGVREKPGAAFDYSDWQMALFWDTLSQKVYGVKPDRADEVLLAPFLAEPLGFEDAASFQRGKPGRLSISPRDFCRFGLLYLRGGLWRGEQIVRADLAKMVRTEPLPNAIPQTKGEGEPMIDGQRSIGGGNNQTDHLGSYSWLWWVNGIDREGRRHWPDVPEDAYGAFGHGGKRAMVIIPSLDMIVSWNETGIEGRETEGAVLAAFVKAVAK